MEKHIQKVSHLIIFQQVYYNITCSYVLCDNNYGQLLNLYNNIDGTRLSDNDHGYMYDKLEDKAARWRDIGRALGFKEGEMDNIQSNPMLLTQSAPKSYLREMLTQWLQWAPGDGRGSTSYATKESLRAALLKANLGQLTGQFH